MAEPPWLGRSSCLPAKGLAPARAVRGMQHAGRHHMLYGVSMRQVAYVGGADFFRARMRQLRLAIAEQLWCLRVACLCAESVSAISAH